VHKLTADLELIRSAGHRAADLVRHLLAFSRRQVLQPARVSPLATIRRAETLLRRVLREDIGLTIRCATRIPDVLLDAVQLESALLNLAINARDAMPDGGQLTVTLTR
jgi:signal transduction histidine kinase